MKKEYVIGGRFKKLKALSVVLNSAIVFMFYFIYRYVFAGRLGILEGAPLAMIFLALGVVIAVISMRIADRYAASVSYRITDDGLVYRLGKREKLFRWKDFSAAKLREFGFSGVHPVEFTVEGRLMMLNQYVDDLCGLTANILDRIEDHVQIDPELRKRTSDLRGVY